jgi:hypothetical protein
MYFYQTFETNSATSHHDEAKGSSTLKTSAKIFAGISMIVGGLCLFGAGSLYVVSSQVNFAVPYPWELAAPAPENDYLQWEFEPAPRQSRLPKKFSQFNVDLFSHPVVVEAFQKASVVTKNTCQGPSGNIDVWYNHEAVQNDLTSTEGYTVFDFDCRDSKANPLIAFIVVLDMNGNIAAIHNPPVRAESVNMYSTDLVMFSCISGEGVYLWNWKENTVEKLPIAADAHTVQYSQSEKKFYGLYLDEEGMTKFSPSVAVAFDAETGDYTWAFEPEYSHVNYFTVNGKYAYLSLRSAGCLQKVDMETSEVVWTLGGKYSDFHVFDKDANFLDANKRLRNTFKVNPVENIFGSFQHQHKFQHLSDVYFSLFDNNVCSNSQFCNQDSSRMVILKLDETLFTASEIFSYSTGDQAMIYGGADVLPSGNVLGNSYNKAVYPLSSEYQYHANIWEVTLEGDIAWRASFKGLNPWNPKDVETEYSHSIQPGEEPPVGWMIYNAERFYAKPVVGAPCAAINNYENRVLQVLPYNTIRTSEDMPGAAYLYDKLEKKLISKTEFQFQKSWIPRKLHISIPEEVSSVELALLVVNSWEEGAMIDIGKLSALQSCSEVEKLTRRLPNAEE